jgi:hypothetical protein
LTALEYKEKEWKIFQFKEFLALSAKEEVEEELLSTKALFNKMLEEFSITAPTQPNNSI